MEEQALHVASGEGKTAWVLGQLMTFKLHGASREVGIFEMAIPPGGGAPTHFHRSQEETHILLEGRYEFLLGDHRIQVGPGDIVYVRSAAFH